MDLSLKLFRCLNLWKNEFNNYYMSINLGKIFYIYKKINIKILNQKEFIVYENIIQLKIDIYV